mmetsp:Transcript_36487/g.85287  ORF Transcript_36487/g.85287 Transcript_36487/m.85287 type:complete len:82 (+) Transcript_36487:1254-1499(+)
MAAQHRTNMKEMKKQHGTDLKRLREEVNLLKDQNDRNENDCKRLKQKHVSNMNALLVAESLLCNHSSSKLDGRAKSLMKES